MSHPVEHGERMIQQHTRAGIAHHFAHSHAHLGGIAMYPAVPARRFVVAMRAKVKPVCGILQKLLALAAKFRAALPFMVVLAAVDPYHFTDCAFLVRYHCCVFSAARYAPQQFGAQSVYKCVPVHVYDLDGERCPPDVE